MTGLGRTESESVEKDYADLEFSKSIITLETGILSLNEKDRIFLGGGGGGGGRFKGTDSCHFLLFKSKKHLTNRFDVELWIFLIMMAISNI